MAREPRPDYIVGVIRLEDGTESSFSIHGDGGWQQWGAVSRERLGATVDVLEAMAQAAAEHMTSDHDEDGDEEDDEDGDE